MNYLEWKKWLRSLPWLLRWFVILVLLRPIIDSFWYLKHTSPLLSPLNIVGVLTPALGVLAMLKFQKPNNSLIDSLFKGWLILTTISTLLIFISESINLTSLRMVLKITLPLYLYFFIRILVRSERDLHGILQTFLYSCLFVVGIFLYEVIFQPVRVEYTRGVERLQGNYADVVSYGSYVSLGFLVICYFYLLKKRSLLVGSSLKSVLIAAVICILCLFKMNHMTSYAVFTGLVLIFLYYHFRAQKTAAMGIIMLMVAAFFFYGQRVLEEKINPLIETDIAVLEGEKDRGRLLHGRMWRWEENWKTFSRANAAVQFLGMPAMLRNVYGYIGPGAHNDFYRVLLFTGWFGLINYLLILLTVFKRCKYINLPQHFLTVGVMAILTLYSITTCPTTYPNFMYITLAIFSYVALPKITMRPLIRAQVNNNNFR